MQKTVLVTGATSGILRVMKYSEYEKYIVPTIEHCLVSLSNNKAVSKFINLIESNSIYNITRSTT